MALVQREGCAQHGLTADEASVKPEVARPVGVRCNRGSEGKTDTMLKFSILPSLSFTPLHGQSNTAFESGQLEDGPQADAKA